MEQSILANTDEYGQLHISTNELCDLLYQNVNLDLSTFLVSDATQFNCSSKQLHYDTMLLQQYHQLTIGIEEFDLANQREWHMPPEYQDLDIAKWILDQCIAEAELQRVGLELLLYQERGLFPLLRYTKYLVDTLRKNNVLWGVGRGSSVASYVLYLIGIHRINSLHYELDIAEFLR